MKKFFDLLWNKNPPAQQSVPLENTISMSLDKEDNVKIKLLFGSNSVEAAEQMGIFLYELNSGALTKNILDLMMELGNNNKEFHAFVQNAVLVWLKNIKENESSVKQSNQPLILPSEFIQKQQG